MRLLVVEDDVKMAALVRRGLTEEGAAVDVARSGEDALWMAAAAPYDALVLDVMLPGIDGFSVASELRRTGIFVPILMLTARGRAEDVLRGFEAGADDYLPKPFELSILMARVRGLLRRDEWLRRSADTPAQAASQPPDRFSFAGKVIDFAQLELRVGDKHLPLTLMEASLLRYLVQHEGKPVSRKTILENVWGLHEDTDTRAIDNFIVRLRRYIEVEPSRPAHLRTVRGVGYRFVAEPPASPTRT